MKLHPPQSPLSVSWLGEAKTAQKSAKSSQGEAQPGSGSSAIPEAARRWRQQNAGARAVSEDTLNKKKGQYLQIPSGTNLFNMRDGKLMSKGSLAEGRYKLEMNKHSDNRMPKETTKIYKVKEWKSEKIKVNAKLEESEPEDCTKIRRQQNQIKSLHNQISSTGALCHSCCSLILE